MLPFSSPGHRPVEALGAVRRVGPLAEWPSVPGAGAAGAAESRPENLPQARCEPRGGQEGGNW